MPYKLLDDSGNEYYRSGGGDGGGGCCFLMSAGLTIVIVGLFAGFLQSQGILSSERAATMAGAAVVIVVGGCAILMAMGIFKVLFELISSLKGEIKVLLYLVLIVTVISIICSLF